MVECMPSLVQATLRILVSSPLVHIVVPPPLLVWYLPHPVHPPMARYTKEVKFVVILINGGRGPHPSNLAPSTKIAEECGPGYHPSYS